MKFLYIIICKLMVSMCIDGCVTVWGSACIHAWVGPARCLVGTWVIWSEGKHQNMCVTPTPREGEW